MPWSLFSYCLDTVVTASCMNAVHVPCSKPARHTGVLDIYRYTLARRYAGALVYYLARRSHFEKKTFISTTEKLLQDCESINRPMTVSIKIWDLQIWVGVKFWGGYPMCGSEKRTAGCISKREEHNNSSQSITCTSVCQSWHLHTWPFLVLHTLLFSFFEKFKCQADWVMFWILYPFVVLDVFKI